MGTHQVPRTVGNRDVELNRARSLLFRGSQEGTVSAVTQEHTRLTEQERPVGARRGCHGGQCHEDQEGGIAVRPRFWGWLHGITPSFSQLLVL